MDSLIEALSKILRVNKPWLVEKIDVHSPTKTVNVFISFEPASWFPCAEFGNPSKMYDGNYRA